MMLQRLVQLVVRAAATIRRVTALERETMA
jgi:hypothetical protein